MRVRKVDVVIGTYNHEKFISQAIESVLEQKTDFLFRVIIGDDGSLDNTQNIIKKYAKKYPKIITTILYKKNKGLIGKDVMRRKLYENCTAQYVTILEGDDYWRDSYKLQQQVDFMESNKDCVICYHPVKIEYIGNVVRFWDQVYGINRKLTYTIEEFLKEPLIPGGKWPEIPTPGMMLRWSLNPKLPKWFWYILRADSALHLLFSYYGYIKCMSKDCMAIQRKHEGGVSSLFAKDPDFMEKDFLKVHVFIDRHFNYKYHELIRPHIKRGISYLKRRNNVQAFNEIMELCKGVYPKNLFIEIFSSK